MAFALVLVLGIFMGYQQRGEEGSSPGLSANRGRVVHILDRIEQLYVDPVMREDLEAAAVEAILDELDPHSMYFSEEELAAMAEPMTGNFEGIGVEFILQDDTLMVVAAIPGGPAEKMGIRAGDRILTVDSMEISGPELTNQKVMEWLKGPRNTTVVVGLDRPDGIEEIGLLRDRIPIHSVVAALPIHEDVGYIKVIRFAQNTAEEFEEAMEALDAAGMQHVMVDLRGNGGGYLNAVVPMVESFLSEDEVVVYTEGVHSARRTYRARVDGQWKHWGLTVLVDESSASASEIFAGAIQDNDRGFVVGRRTFGKGLVQEEFDVSGQGALRLTVARFHTPTGRAIQKPYGGAINYEDDYFARYERGELFNADSIKVVDSLKYVTPQGRMVHGGGGIVPDFFVPMDTSSWTSYLRDISWSGLLRDGAFAFVDRERATLEILQSPSDFTTNIEERAVTYLLEEASLSGMEPPSLTDEELHVLTHRFMAQVARNVFGESAYHGYLAEEDKVVNEAIQWLESAQDLEVINGRLTLPSKLRSEN